MWEDLSHLSAIDHKGHVEPGRSARCVEGVDSVVHQGTYVIVEGTHDVTGGYDKRNLTGQMGSTVNHQTPLCDGLLDQFELLPPRRQRTQVETEHLLQVAHSSMD